MIAAAGGKMTTPRRMPTLPVSPPAPMSRRVTEPIRLHVAAKRYLCTVEPGYAASLSPASVYTLGVQGGPMQRAELAEFEANWYAATAIRLRRWDDMAKETAVQVPGFDHYTATLRALAR